MVVGELGDCEDEVASGLQRPGPSRTRRATGSRRRWRTRGTKALLGISSSDAHGLLTSKRNKETFQGALMGTHAAMPKPEMTLPSKTAFSTNVGKESLKGVYLAGPQVTGELSRLNAPLKGALDTAKVMSEVGCLTSGALSVLSPAMGQGAVSRFLDAIRRLAQCHLASLLVAS